MRYTVCVSFFAERNVQSILKYLATQSARGAEQWFQRWCDALMLLAVTAGGCGLAPESADHPEAIRQMMFKTRRGRLYRALFIVRGDQCLILHVRGAGQDLIPPNEMGIPN